MSDNDLIRRGDAIAAMPANAAANTLGPCGGAHLNAVLALRAQLAEATDRADRAEASRAAQIEADARIADCYADQDYCALGYPEDGGIAASGTADMIRREIRNQPHDRTALDRIIADTLAERDDLRAKLDKAVDVLGDTFYIDCEFDGHDGPLLSIAMVRGDGYSLHIEVIEEAKDPWVIANVMPIMGAHKADVMRVAEPDFVGSVLRQFIGDCPAPTIIADSPVDIGRFCRAISTGKDGKWQSADFSQMKFVVHNVDCYPTTMKGAVQHNAWWDAMALRATLAAMKEG